MDPFFILELEQDATDEEVAKRYRELVVQYPPEVRPREFALIRAAYEALVDHRSRIAAKIFTFDRHGRELSESLPVWRRGQPRKRLADDHLARLLRCQGAKKVEKRSGK